MQNVFQTETPDNAIAYNPETHPPVFVLDIDRQVYVFNREDYGNVFYIGRTLLVESKSDPSTCYIVGECESLAKSMIIQEAIDVDGGIPYEDMREFNPILRLHESHIKTALAI